MLCANCNQKIKGYGHNGNPLVDGTVCDDCNIEVLKKRMGVSNYSQAEEKAKQILPPIYIAKQGAKLPEGYKWVDNLTNGMCRVFYEKRLTDEQVNQYNLKYEWEM